MLVLFAFLFSGAAFAQKGKISGTIVDESNEPVIGATIMEKGTQNGAVTDIDGHFTVNGNRVNIPSYLVKTGDVVSVCKTLRISYVGFITQELKAKDGMRIVLKEEASSLNEVVVIGYGSVRRKDVTTAVSSVSTEDLDTRPIVSAAQGMQGKAAGLPLQRRNLTGQRPAWFVANHTRARYHFYEQEQ